MAFFPKEFVVKYTVVSSDITTSPVLLVPPMNSGDIYIKDIVVTSDATGLAGGTNLVLTTDSAFGSATIFSGAVSSLGANGTIALDYNVNTTKVLSSGASIFINSTVAPCTGAGKINIYFYCQQATEDAEILGPNN